MEVCSLSDSVNLTILTFYGRHVFRDLRPYICTYEDCQNPDKQYTTRHDWAYHERQMHRRQWVCEEHDKTKFPTKDLFVQHINDSHSVSLPNYQLSVLINISEREIDETENFPCPLCPDEGRLKTLQDHIAEHLESISLFVLPAEIEGEDETNSQDVAGGEMSSRLVSEDSRGYYGAGRMRFEDAAKHVLLIMRVSITKNSSVIWRSVFDSTTECISGHEYLSSSEKPTDIESEPVASHHIHRTAATYQLCR